MGTEAGVQQALPSRLNLGCGEEIHPNAHNVDRIVSPGVDELVDLAELPWPWPDESFQVVYASHILEHLPDLEGVLHEVERVLVPDGQLIVRWPVGMNERADPDHEHRWVWDTPLYYCGERPWDVDVGLEVVDRDVSVHVHLNGIARSVYRLTIGAYELRHGQGRWLFDLPATSGEFRVVFQK